MIDITNEQLLTLAQAAALLPGRPSTSTLWRWRTRGVQGRRLESVAIGGKILTSAEAIQRFARQQGGAEPSTIRSPRQRERAIQRAERELRDDGV